MMQSLIEIFPLSAFQDNYIWVMLEKSSSKMWVVDPGDAIPVLEFADRHAVDVAGVLITHHHADHSGGVEALTKRFKNIPVYASRISSVPFVTHPLTEGEEISCGNIKLKALEIPGHTLDHLAFYNNDMLFCGDTLFSGGCGRVFEGTYPQMYRSLQKLIALPESIKVYCGHEYTLQNLKFAQQVEPDNLFIAEKIFQVQQQREMSLPSLPSQMSEEKEMNPFLRCQKESVVQAVQTYTKKTIVKPEEIFQCLREWKNKF
jgi:hydroxyacylglutathione hydrolase